MVLFRNDISLGLFNKGMIRLIKTSTKFYTRNAREQIKYNKGVTTNDIGNSSMIHFFIWNHT